MENNEPGEASTPTDPTANQDNVQDANAFEGENKQLKPLTVDVNKADTPDESISVNLGKAGKPDEPISHVRITFDLEKEVRVRVAVESLPPSGETSTSEEQAETRIVIESQGGEEAQPKIILQPPTSGVSPLARIQSALRRWPYSFETTLFGLALLVYLITHLVGLTRFPIYFFTDEAIQTEAAANLIRDGFRDEEGTLLPTYFKNGPYYNLSISVYLQVLPYLFFGKSVFITRATSVLISLLAAISVGLMLRDIFMIPYWWVGVSLLSIAPAWFLHSRTAFETVVFTSFYAACLYFYLLYRYRSPRYLYYTILLGALAFYSYSPGQIVIGLTGILLLLSDARYHWENRRTILSGLGLALILALPYLRFRVSHPAAAFEHLRILDSYWVQPLSFQEKLSRFGSEYLYGLSPSYWFLPNNRDLVRHIMKGYGHLLRATLPLAVLGLILAIWRIKSSSYRTILIALLATPVGAALVLIGITRTLVLVIPGVILIGLGLNQIMTWLEKVHIPPKILAVGVFALLSAYNFLMLRDVLVNAPTWYQDYGLGGMQYGAQQLFPKIEAYLEKEPETEMILSPTWANGTDIVARFFLGFPMPIDIGSIEGHMFQRLPLDENTLFVMTPEEYQKTISSEKFTDIQVEDTLPYPNGKPGFYFVRLQYVDNIDTILEHERQERRKSRSAEVELDGEAVKISYPMLDMGEIQQLFDGDPYTLCRTLEANPAVFELSFPEPRSISGVSVIIGSTETEIRVLLYQNQDSEPVEYVQTFQGTVDQPEVHFDFEETTLTQNVRIELRDLRQGEPGHVHVWEIIFQN